MQDEAFRDKVNALLDNPCPEELPETVSILQVLVEDYGTGAIAEKVKKPLEGIKVACYYGCLMSRPADIMQFDDAENPMAMDNIMTALGAEVVPFPLKTECCGAAMGIPRRDITARLTGRILERAQAFGADAVLIGRPFCLAAVGGGSEGVKLTADHLYNQLVRSMGLTGCPSVREAGRHLVSTAPLA